MYQLSYRDLEFRPVLLRPETYFLQNGETVRQERKGKAEDMVRVLPEQHAASVGMDPGIGKITDAGYDQAACLAAGIPACTCVRFRASIRVLEYPAAGERNGQEGLGLFFRDTMDLDPLSGYPYSNLAAAGIFAGAPGLVGRSGITEDSIERILPVSCRADAPDAETLAGKRLEILLEKNGNRLRAEIGAEGEEPWARFETEAGGEIFSSREPGTLYLGFLAARGCRLEADLDSVSVEVEDPAEEGGALPALYAGPGGSASGEGTPASPLDLRTAIGRCRFGQEIRILPGRYRLQEDLVISKADSGMPGMGKKILPAERDGAWAVLDFGGTEHGFRLEGDCWEISGILLTRGFGLNISGSRNRIHHCAAVANQETGFQIRHPQNDSPRAQWPSHNEISDCVSCLNRDVSEQNADGFACKVAAGPGNRFLRCTAWMNSDDGFDLFSKNRPIGAVRLEDCRSWLNGYALRDGSPAETRGNGNGFKLGGSGLAVDHAAYGCEAFGNRGFGFTSNSNPHMRLSACLAGSNRKNYFFYFTGLQVQPVCIREDCTEQDDPAFDPGTWAGEHLLGVPGGKSPASCAEDLVRAMEESTAEERNAEILRQAAGTLRLRCREAADRPGILILSSSLYGGGAERVACLLASSFAERFRVYLLCIQDKGRTYPLDPRIRTFVMPRFYGSGWEPVMESRAEYARQLKEILGIRVSISFMFTMNKVNVLSRGPGKVICSERNSPLKRYPEHMEEIESLYAAADHVVFQSETVRDLFSPAVREHSSVILNPVAVSCARTGGSRRIVNIGRLVPQKNQALLLRAFRKFARSHPEHTLSLYGTGELSRELQELAASLGIREKVQFHGQVRDVHAAAADAEMFVLSSDYEGLSNALLESMMMGFPCISTRCEGSVDVIRPGGNGLLTGIGSEEQLAEAMALLADDAELRERLGAEAARSSEPFRAEHVLRQWEQLIEQLTEEN